MIESIFQVHPRIQRLTHFWCRAAVRAGRVKEEVKVPVWGPNETTGFQRLWTELHQILRKRVLKSGSLGLCIMLQIIYSSVVVSTATYASETWKSTSNIQKKSGRVTVFDERNLRKIIEVTWKNKVTNAKVLKWTGHGRLQDIVGERRFRFSGHIVRVAPERLATMDWTPADCRRRGRPKNTWRATFREDIQAREVSWSEVETIAADRIR